MAGLAELCKQFGSMTINGERWLWNYAENRAVPEKDMPKGSERRKASDRAKRNTATEPGVYHDGSG